MALHESHIVLALLFLVSWANLASAAYPDFQKARDLINKTSPNISYDSFCLATPGGEDKIACRIKAYPSVGFLVCKKPVYVEEEEQISCKDLIKKELGVLQELGQNNVKTVMVSPPQIDGVKCGVDASLGCSGFLEEWVDKDVGRFIHIRDTIVSGSVNKTIKEVKNYTQDGALLRTAADLKIITAFMIVDKSRDKYRQICDLQGFFLKKGGFLINDIPSIDDVKYEEPCWEGEPKTKEVLAAIDDMIEAFTNTQATGAGAVWNAGQLDLLGVYCIFVLCVTNMISVY